MKESTQNDYEKAVNKVIDYINHHLFETPGIQTLAEVANISGFHFHRIFKVIIGENIGEYINRIRLEYIAERLQMSNRSWKILPLRQDMVANTPSPKHLKSTLDFLLQHSENRKRILSIFLGKTNEK